MQDKKIVKVSIVCAQGADWYMVGQKGIETIDEEVKQIHKDARATFYVCRDKDKKLVAEISANAPVVVEWK